MEQKPVTNEISADITHQAQGQAPDTSNPKWMITSILPDEHSNGSYGVETLHCHEDSGGVFTEDDHFALSNDGMSELSDSSLPEVCISSNTKLVKEEMNYEVQQAYRIFSEFLTEKHKVITSAFLHPIVNEDQETQYCFGGVRSRCPVNVRQSMCLRRMEEKFVHQEYETITEFVADFRLMLENCYRYRGVDHWLSKQAQKLEIMLEQKLTLLSRKLREKTTLAVTSKGQFGVGEERPSSSSTRRRPTRSIKTLNVGGHESIMVQTLRAEAQQRAREEKRQREFEKKEAEEMSAKEIDEWEQNLLSQASPHNVETLWELPAIGHFLCLAQTALNLPEIVFFELERCLLMPRCSILLSKIMSSLLCPPQRRSTLQRYPVLTYRRWESELRQTVKGWYQSVGSSHDQTAQADLLGLCHQFFTVLGEISPLEAKAFHMLPFYQRVWLLKGLCDHVYETQKDVQIAVLAQPIHECRESILGYDSKENAYIHFPHFCGADLRIYCQSPCTPPNFPFPSVLVKKIEILDKMEEETPSTVKNTSEVYGTNLNEKMVKADLYTNLKIESTDGEDVDRCQSKVEPHTNSSPIKRPTRKHILIEETSDQGFDLNSKKLKHDIDSSCPFHRNETIHKRCQSDEEHCYTGRSPAGSVTGFPFENLRFATGSVGPRDQRPSCINKISHVKPEQCQCCCSCSELGTQLSSERAHTSCEERMNDKILTKKKKWRQKKGREQMSNIKLEQKRSHPIDERLPCAKTPKPSVPTQCTASKRKVKRRQVKEGNNLPLAKKIKHEPHAGPSFKLICTNLDDLRELINKTEDELDVLESTKKKMNQWFCRREAVKDLHSTLVRLLNELTPWEPKLIKAYQRNRLRLKKEFEDFRSHPEFSNFVREKSISSSSATSSSSSSSDDEEGKLGFKQCSRSAHEYSEHILPRVLGGSVKELSTELSADIPVSHSYNRQKRSLSTTSDNSDHSLKNTFTSEQNHQTVKSGHSYSVQLQTIPLLKPNFLHTASRQPKSYTPIPTLLAKSVGNKVTLMKQPADHLEIDSINGDSKGTVVSTGDINLLKLNNCSSGPQQNSLQKHDVFYKELNHLVGSSNSKLRCEEIKPQQVCTSTNVAGFTTPVQQVPPSENTGLTETSLCSSNILRSLRSQPSVINSARSKGTQHCDGQTSTPQYALKNITSAHSSLSKSTDAKQELKTVCIRESQSILVTTRGGNTGIVQVQKSSDHTAGASKSPIITISPQFQAFLVSKTSPVYSSNTAQCDKISTATTGSEVQAGAETPSISQEVNKCQGLTGSSGYTSTINPDKQITAVSCPLAVVKNVNPSLSNFITSQSLTAADLISKPHFNQTNHDNGSHIAKLILFSPSSPHDVNVSCTKTLSTSVKLVNQHTPNSSSISIQSNNTVQTQATTTGAKQQVMETSSAPSKMNIHTSSVNSVSIAKNKGVFVTSGTSTYPTQFPCLITTTIPRNTQSSTTCRDTEQMVTATTQTVFANSNVISSAPAPATSLSSLKHLGISSITINSQPRNVTCPSTKSLPAENLQKKHGFSNTMWSSNLEVQPATSQSTINPISALGLKHKSLNNPFMSNASGPVDETSLSPPLSFTRPQDSSAVHRSTTTSSATSLTSSVQQQMVINTSTHLAGGTRIVLNNAHFVVPPQGLSPGSHVIVISGHAQKVPSTSVNMEATVPFQGVNKEPVFLQPSTRLPSVPAIGSPFVACTSAVGCTVQATIPIISVPRPNGLNNMLVNKIDSVAKSTFFQTENTGRPKASVVSTVPNIVPLVSTMLTNKSTTAASLGLALPRESPPILSSDVLIQPIKADPAQLLNVAAISSSQGLMSPTQMTKGLSERSLAAEVPSQHPTIRVASIYSSTSTALLHMGLGSVSFQKHEHPVSTTTQSAPPVMSLGTLPCSGGHAKAVESRPLSNSSTCTTAALSLPYRERTTHCPVIVTDPAMEKHLQHTSFLEMRNPVMSKLLSPDGAVLSTVQCKAKPTLPESPAGLLISTAALQAEDLLLQPSHVNLKFDN